MRAGSINFSGVCSSRMCTTEMHTTDVFVQPKYYVRTVQYSA